MPPAIQFEKTKTALVLLYTPLDDNDWVEGKFERDGRVDLKGTYHFRPEHLIKRDAVGDDDLVYRFRLGRRKAEYYALDTEIFGIDYAVLIHHTATIHWRWFTAEKRISVLHVIAKLRPKRIVIGGEETDAIPETEYRKLIDKFPNYYEQTRYVLARVSAVVRDFADVEIDGEKLFRAYGNQRIKKRPRDLIERYKEVETEKYEFLLKRLQGMLNPNENDSYSENAWQKEILEIVLLLNPKYIAAFKSVTIKDCDIGGKRQLDIMLVDAGGNVDLIEIKQPFEQCIVSDRVYRDNHIPLRELSGSVMQIEKYIYLLTRWGPAGEKELTERYQKHLPPDFSLKITNPSGIVIMGRDNNLSAAQRHDFEVIKRKYKNVVDIITYDDLIRRLEAVVKQYKTTASRILMA